LISNAATRVIDFCACIIYKEDLCIKFDTLLVLVIDVAKMGLIYLKSV